MVGMVLVRFAGIGPTLIAGDGTTRLERVTGEVIAINAVALVRTEALSLALTF
jgi:hypothetical protein